MSEQIKEVQVAVEKRTANEEKASEMDFIYVNAVETFGSLWDLRIVFGDRKPNGEMDRRTAIVMSHRHAKALTQVLAHQVRRLEKAYGDIGTTGIDLEVDDAINEDAEASKPKNPKAGG